MQWTALLSSKRIGKLIEDPVVPHRSPYEIDADRITFSSAFRRLQDKMQVHGRDGSDYVRTRLTHSLEASRVGRSLGAFVGRTIAARHLPAQPWVAADIGHIVAAAALAHDIGNPPFGHAAERMIGHWFAAGAGAALIRDLAPRLQAELTSPEGNAQGFRVLTRLQGWRPVGGLQLTAATLGAFTKYPRAAQIGHVGQQKYGFYETEAADFADIAACCELQPLGPLVWARHPLAFLTEAADDICYLVVDIEDGVKMAALSLDDARDLLMPLVGDAAAMPTQAGSDPDRWLQSLRSLAIDRLIGEAATVFLDQEPAILAGRAGDDLLSASAVADQVTQIRQFSRDRLYRSARRRELEQRAETALLQLLHHHAPALGDPAGMSDRLRSLLDYIFGMTDSFALQQAAGLPDPGSGGA